MRVTTVTASLVVESHPVFHPDAEVVQAWRAASKHVGSESELELTIKDSRVWL